MAETPNYNLRYPVGTDPVDVAGDIANLAGDVDGALGGLWVDADNDDLTGLPSTGRPLSFFGGGRPDTGYPELANAPIGSTFTCTNPDNNFGARVWRKTGATNTGWKCVDGVCKYEALDIQNTVTRINKVTLERHCNDIAITFNFTALADYVTQGPNHPLLLPQGWKGASGRAYQTLATHYWQIQNAVYQSSAIVHLGGVAVYGVARTDHHQNWVHGIYRTDDAWPTQPPVFEPGRSLAELEAELEAIKDDPEKAEQLEQLKAELKELENE